MPQAKHDTGSVRQPQGRRLAQGSAPPAALTQLDLPMIECRHFLSGTTLTQVARKALAEVDRMIDNLKLLNRPYAYDQLTVYRKDWDTIERALQKASHKQASLATHTYRGLKLVRGGR